MGFSKKVISEVRAQFQQKREKSERSRNIKLGRVYSLCPEIKAVDDTLRTTASQIAGAIRLGKDDCVKEIERIKSENLALQKRREELILSLGLPSDYTAIKHECPICEDTGYTESGTLCKCYKTALTYKSYEHSGLSKLLEKQDFETFSLNVYPGDCTQQMRAILKEAKLFVAEFNEEKPSFLFLGETGLGKTHLSTAIAKELIENGHYVIYEIAQNIFSDFERDRMILSRSRFDYNLEIQESYSDKYLECDLLIIDDLGTEIVTPMSISYLYTIVNTRLNKGLSTIINSNLKIEEIQEVYNDRIASRFLGDFLVREFSGFDMRILKNIQISK